MFVTVTNTKRVKATKIKADCSSGTDIISPKLEIIKLGNVCPDANKDVGILFLLPMTIATAMVSPRALPNPRSMAEMIPGPAALNRVFFIICHLVDPKDKEISLNSTGKARNDSTVRDTIIGKTITVSVIEAVNKHIPVVSIWNHFFISTEKTGTNPNNMQSPNTTEGIPAKTSIKDDRYLLTL